MAHPLPAQHWNVIHGRVTDSGGHAVSGADVVVTSAATLENVNAITDTTGRFRVVVLAEGDQYLLLVRALGFAPHEQRLRFAAGDSVIKADAVLARVAVQQLLTMHVRAPPVRPKPRGSFAPSAPGADATYAGGVSADLTPDQMGDLTAIARLTPGVAAGSVFGLPTSDNGVFLNGLGFAGAQLPRDADVRMRIATSQYDPSIGGYSGLLMSGAVDGGSLYATRRGHVTLDAPALEYNDPVAAGSGYRFGRTTVSGAATGGTLGEHLFYNVSGQITQQLTATSDLLDADSTLLAAAGIAPDSVRRLVTAAESSGIPLSPRPVPHDAIARTAVFLGRLDLPKPLDGPGGSHDWSLVLYTNLSQRRSLGRGVTAAPSLGDNENSALLAAQLIHSSYFGPRGTWLNEFRSGLTSSMRRFVPWIAAPGAQVLVGSSLPDAASGIASLGLGGGATTGSHATSWTWEIANTTQWYAHDSTNTMKLYVDSRFDHFFQWTGGDNLGAFWYRSLADLAANQPASYTRTLSAPAAVGGEWSGALALGDFWRKSPTFELEGGVRLQGSRYLTTVERNPAVAATFGLRNNVVPNAVDVSPRLGFTWVMGRGQRAQDIGEYSYVPGTFYEGPVNVLRGGVGEWSNRLEPTLIAGPEGATGLAGASQTLSCIGSATPTPDWPAFMANPANVPSACTGPSSGALSDAAPAVQLIDPSYTGARSWRANLNWESRVLGFRYRIDGTYALDLNQPGVYDLNFNSVPQFHLAAEAGRPVFVPPSSIVPTTGLVSPVSARVSPRFGNVTASRSDLRQTARQLTIQLTPDFAFSGPTSQQASFWRRLWTRTYLSAAYTYSDSRGNARGFDGTTAGNPTAVEWANVAPHHQFQLQVGVRFARYVALEAFAVVHSGLPYTPMVSGDINGDGAANDQAFVFDPSRADSLMASQMTHLLRGAPKEAQRCLVRQFGRVAGRNSCTGPWAMTLNLRLDVWKPIPLWGGRFARVGVNFANPLGGLDLLLHGQNGLKGWGTDPTPDPTLYYVRGFDPSTREFVYEVNPRFGTTRASQSTLRDPFRVTVDIALDLTQPFGEQVLDRALALVRRYRNDPLGAVDTLRRRLEFNTPSAYEPLLRLRDTLRLTRLQVDSLGAREAMYRERQDSLITSFARYLVTLPADFKMVDVRTAQTQVTEAVSTLAQTENAAIRRILSPAQYHELPPYVAALLAEMADVKPGNLVIF